MRLIKGMQAAYYARIKAYAFSIMSTELYAMGKVKRNQDVFCQTRTTVAQMLTPTGVIEGVGTNHLPSIITFIDLKKASFFPPRHNTWIRDPAKSSQAIERLCSNAKVRVISADGQTELRNITAGVLQGDNLAPFPLLSSVTTLWGEIWVAQLHENTT